MGRLLVHVEGETEEAFVSEVLRPHLVNSGYHSVSARLLGNARARERRGGIQSWDVVKRDIVRHLSGDHGCIATLMVDYYALPSSWPGRAIAPSAAIEHRGVVVEDALAADMQLSTPYAARFEPFVLMHEFEALLFSDCPMLALALGNEALTPRLQHVRQQFVSPEHINDSPQTAPSKRIISILPSYRKVIQGTIAADAIGLPRIRAECKNFDHWMGRLEARVAF